MFVLNSLSSSQPRSPHDREARPWAFFFRLPQISGQFNIIPISIAGLPTPPPSTRLSWKWQDAQMYEDAQGQASGWSTGWSMGLDQWSVCITKVTCCTHQFVKVNCRKRLQKCIAKFSNNSLYDIFLIIIILALATSFMTIKFQSLSYFSLKRLTLK